jgi:uncharacterized phiE125 gp8 family phage protein
MKKNLARVAEADGGVALGTALTLADAKAHCSVIHTDDDTLIASLIEAARSHIEGSNGTGGVLGRAITRHVLELSMESFPSSYAELPLPQPPLVSVASVKYYDQNNTLQTFASTNWHAVKNSVRPVIQLASGVSWPATYERPDAVIVRYTAGPETIEEDIKHSLRLLVCHYYLNREVAMEKSLSKMPMGLDGLLSPHKTHWF